jgi:carotenoid cleavage dioxygenase-like enzyme
MQTAADTTAATSGYELGFSSLADETRIDSLPVHGQMPDWLTGTLVRTGPAQWEAGERSLAHWFDGMAMLHAFSFGPGGVSYANRFLEGRAYRHVREHGELGYGEFATDPCRALFKRVTQLFRPGFSDNGNVNVVKLGVEWVAMTEAPIPIAFDERTLAAAGVAWRPPG